MSQFGKCFAPVDVETLKTPQNSKKFQKVCMIGFQL